MLRLVTVQTLYLSRLPLYNGCRTSCHEFALQYRPPTRPSPRHRQAVRSPCDPLHRPGVVAPPAAPATAQPAAPATAQPHRRRRRLRPGSGASHRNSQRSAGHTREDHGCATACDAVSIGPGMDLLVFPDCVRYLGLSAADIPIFVADHLVADHLTGNTASRRLAALRNSDR